MKTFAVFQVYNHIMKLLNPENIDFISSHGQTVFHMPKDYEIGGIKTKSTLQIGDISVKAVVGKNYKLSKYNFFSLQNISLSNVIDLSNIVAEGIYEVIKYA